MRKVLIVLKQSNVLPLCIVIWRPSYRKDAVELVESGATTWEQRSFNKKLCKDASCRPYICTRTVVICTKEYLRWPIDMSDLVLRVGELLAVGTRHTEINELEGAIASKHQIVGFQIAMQDEIGVHVLQSTQYLVSQVLDVFWLE